MPPPFSYSLLIYRLMQFVLKRKSHPVSMTHLLHNLPSNASCAINGCHVHLLPSLDPLSFAYVSNRLISVRNCRWQICWSSIGIRVWKSTLQWRHNGRECVSNHQPHDCLLNRLFGRSSKKTSKLRVTGLCAGNSPGTGEFPAQMASNAENVSIWWRHHDLHPCHCFV